MPYAPFDMGNVLAQSEAIVGRRNQNALARQQLDPNSLQNQLRAAQIQKLQYDIQNPTEGKKPASNIQYDIYRLQMLKDVKSGKRPEADLARFDNWVAREKIFDVGNVPTAYNAGDPRSLSTEDYELNAAQAMKNRQQLGVQGAQGGVRYDTPIAPTDMDLGVQSGAPVPSAVKSAAILAGDAEEQKKVGAHKGKLTADQAGRDLSMAALFSKTSNLDEQIGHVKKLAENVTATGWAGDKSQSIAGTPAHDLYQVLLIIRANAGLDAIREMKESGATLGQVTEAEWPRLESRYAALAQSASKPEFLRNLDLFNKQQKESKTRIQSKYVADYGGPFNFDAYMKQGELQPAGALNKPDFVTDSEWSDLTEAQKKQLAN